MKHKINNIAFLVIFILAGTIAASAQHGYRITKRVTFKRGEVGTTLRGSIPNTLEVHEYIFRARKGQVLKATLHATQRFIGFYIMSPTNSMVEEETFLKNYTNDLEESGDFHLFVYTTKGSGRYTLDLQIASDI